MKTGWLEKAVLPLKDNYENRTLWYTLSILRPTLQIVVYLRLLMNRAVGYFMRLTVGLQDPLCRTVRRTARSSLANFLQNHGAIVAFWPFHIT